jgi:hypothetical protein
VDAFFVFKESQGDREAPNTRKKGQMGMIFVFGVVVPRMKGGGVMLGHNSIEDINKISKKQGKGGYTFCILPIAFSAEPPRVLSLPLLLSLLRWRFK